MLTFGPLLVRESVYSPGLRQARHSHELSNVTVIVGGQIDESSDSGEYRARASSVVLKAAGCEHEDRVGGHGARTITLQFDRSSAFGAAMRERAWAWFDQPEIVRDAIALQKAFDGGGDVERNAVALIESTLAADRGANAPAPVWLTPMRKALEDSFDRTIRFDRLARDFGLHPVYVSRTFHRYIGMSMVHYVRALRVRHARHVLASSRRSVAAIAAEAGFSDASHLCRTFSDLLGVTPRKYRELSGLVCSISRS